MAHWLNTGLSAQATSMRAGVPLPRSQVNAEWAWRSACNSRAQKAKTPRASCLARLVSTGKLWDSVNKMERNPGRLPTSALSLYTHAYTSIYAPACAHIHRSPHICKHTYTPCTHTHENNNKWWINKYMCKFLKLAISSPNTHLSIYSCFVPGEETTTLHFFKKVLGDWHLFWPIGFSGRKCWASLLEGRLRA